MNLPSARLLSADQVAQAEKELIKPSDGSGTMALCLSGGGIRSATFALGVLQGLAERRRLLDFHYLSTVSGGGYIGAWLLRWIQLAESRGTSDDEIQRRLASSFAQPSRDSVPEHDPLERLRAYSNYLSPTAGMSIDSLALAAIFLRNLMLNWLVWVPLLLAVMALPRLYVALLVWRPPEGSGGTILFLAGLAAFVLGYGIAYVASDLPGDTQLDLAENARSHFFQKCFLPIFGVSVALSLLAVWATSDGWVADMWHFLLAGMALHVVGVSFGVWRRKRWQRPPRVRNRHPVGTIAMLVSGAAAGAALWVVLSGGGSLMVDSGQLSMLIYATAAVPALLGCFWVTLTVCTGLARRWTAEDDREWWARASAWWLGASLAWAAAFGLVVFLPLWLYGELSQRVSPSVQLGVGGATVGILTSFLGYWSKHGRTWKSRAKSFVDTTGMRMLDVLAWLGVVALLMCMAMWVPWLASLLVPSVTKVLGADVVERVVYLAGDLEGDTWTQAHLAGLLQTPWSAILALLVPCLATSWIMSAFLGANTFSLHSLYGNRLVRAYLGAARPRRNPHWFTGFDPADDVPLTALRRDRRPLFPVVNIALNLVKASDRYLAWQQRKGASFIATPLHCGSAVTGYVSTALFGAGGPGGASTNDGAPSCVSRRTDGRMTLGRAVAISGAAAAPNMGYHSSRPVTLMMTWFNVRLGWWLSNPLWNRRGDRADARHLLRGEPRWPFAAALDEALGRTSDDRDAVYLSDGGHFENLGLYEMVRRGCLRIVVVDATCDPGYAYDDLLRSVRKIRVDLGVRITLPNPLPGPKDVGGRTACVVVGTIHYDGVGGEGEKRTGKLILLKPALGGNLPPEIAHYAEVSRRKGSEFPHQSTSDQFFDETQFESYRLLGYLCAKDAFRGRNDWPRTTPIQPREQPSANSSNGDDGTKGGLLSALSDSMGMAAVATTVATVAGTAGVVGTIALSSGEISLKEADRELLRKGIAMGGASIALSETDRDLLKAGIPVRFAPAPTFRVTFDPADMSIVSEIKALIVSERWTEVQHRLIELRARIERIGSSNDPSLFPILILLDERLRQIETSVLSLTVTGLAPLTEDQIRHFSSAASAAIALSEGGPPPASPAAPAAAGESDKPRPDQASLRKIIDAIEGLHETIKDRLPIHGIPLGGRP